MLIDSIIGIPRDIVLEKAKENLVGINYTNSTIELENIASDFSSNTSHVLLYYDLINSDIMTMAIIKLENLSLINKLKLKLRRDIRCKEYIGCVTFLSKEEAAVAYVRENIIKAF